jgi:hypothetical protein
MTNITGNRPHRYLPRRASVPREFAAIGRKAIMNKIMEAIVIVKAANDPGRQPIAHTTSPPNTPTPNSS